ncbi:MAG: inorganic diphosphatase [Acidobacteria bacterium]|nr:inorganic diphosphatase [Acidobacteriota bacterium]
MSLNSICDIPPFSKHGHLNVIVETPRGSRNKYQFDEDLKMFSLGGVLTAGHSFPYDFGFIPNTLGGDGDPLDVLVMMEEPTFPGCLVRCRLIGGIKAEQGKDDDLERNDRLIAVSAKSPGYDEIDSLHGLGDKVVEQIEHFFISYNIAKGKTFRPLARLDASEAAAIVKAGAKELANNT